MKKVTLMTSLMDAEERIETAAGFIAAADWLRAEQTRVAAHGIPCHVHADPDSGLIALARGRPSSPEALADSSP